MATVKLIKLARFAGRYTVAIYDAKQQVTFYPADRNWYVSAWLDLDESNRIPTVFSSSGDPSQTLQLTTNSAVYREIAHQIKCLFG